MIMERIHYTKRDIKSTLITEAEIKAKVKEVAAQISRDYDGKELVAICILRGCCMFYSDLMKEVDIPVDMEFMATSSYGSGTESSGNVSILYDVQTDIKGKHVLIVEDIIDTGITLRQLKKLLSGREPASIEICVLLDKEERRVTPVDVKYTCFKIPNEFVVGYGLDYNDKYRNYREIGVLKPEIYE